MARWLVSHNDTHFEVNGLADLRDLARHGRLGPGDMVQPPGTSEWMYAIEIPELKDLLATVSPGDDADLPKPRSRARDAVVAVVLLGILGVGGYFAYDFYQLRPDPTKRLTDQVSYEEVVVTAQGASLLSGPEASASAIGPAPAQAAYVLLGKRREFYQVRDAATGTEGWIRVDQVLPMYRFGGSQMQLEKDPLYYPEKFVNVANASWMQLPPDKKKKQDTPITVFQFVLANDSMYDMTDIVVQARIKDAKGHELELSEFKVDGIVPANGSTMVGTLVDPKTEEKRLITQVSFTTVATETPDLALEYADGVEVPMKSVEFTEATLDVVEVRAVKKEAAPE